MKFSEFIEGFFTEVQEVITLLISEDMDGKEKKELLDARILAWALEKLELVKLNILVKLIIKKLLQQYLPTITQSIFISLSTKVKGLKVLG